MRLKLEQEKRIRDIIGSCDYEDKETSITFKCLDKMVIIRLMNHGFVSMCQGMNFLKMMNKYNCVIYGSILKEYNNLPVELGGVKCENVTLEMCEELNKMFNLVMTYPNGTIVWLGFKE